MVMERLEAVSVPLRGCIKVNFEVSDGPILGSLVSVPLRGCIKVNYYFVIINRDITFLFPSPYGVV